MPESPTPSTPPWAQSTSAEAVESFIDEHGPLESGGPSWFIHSDDEAEWAMAHLAAAGAQLAALIDQRDLWLDQLTRWFNDAAKEPKRSMAFFDEHLRRYALDRRGADPKAKTLSLPSGKVPTADSSPKVMILDDDALIAWAESTVYADPFHPPHAELGDTAGTATYADLGVVKVTKEAMVSALRKLVTIVEPACDECDGDGSVDFGDEDHSDVGTCPACDGRGKVLMVVTLAGEKVPGVDVDPGGLTANTPQPVRPVTL